MRMSEKRDRQLERTREVLAEKDQERPAEAEGQPTRSADRTDIEQAVRAENTGHRERTGDK